MGDYSSCAHRYGGMHGEKLVLNIAMFRLIIISKEEAFHICDKSQYYESTLWEKTKLHLRYMWCPNTRHYVDRNKKLTKTIKSSNLGCLHHSERTIIEDRLNEKLKNQM